jgi:general transcription factor 3C polypeptide 3 (transcription factor C subunit 4)
VYREIRIADAAAKNRDSLSWFPTKKRYGLVKGKGKAAAADEDEDEDEEAGSDEDALGFVPAKFNPIPVTLYGQMCNVAKSYQSAICTSSLHALQQTPLTVWGPVYLLHAYDYCPQDPVICLTLGIAYLGRAMQRQSDNRHHLVAQVRPSASKESFGLLITAIVHVLLFAVPRDTWIRAGGRGRVQLRTCLSSARFDRFHPVIGVI